MKIALDWINKYLDRPIDAAEAQHALIHGGLPVENIHDFASVPVLDVEVTSNRTDCFSHIGLARELAALTNRKFSPPPIDDALPLAATIGEFCSIQVTDAADCPFYCARVVRDVTVGPSPEWLRHAVESIGLRSINNVVDITNFLLMDTGQPLHAFDLDKLTEHRIVVRRARPGETMMSIDGHGQKLDDSMLVIADGAGPVAVAGIMGSKPSEVTEQTRNILIESAQFHPGLVRAAARKLGLFSDSSFRFERGIDPAAAESTSRRAVALIAKVCGGKAAAGSAVGGSYNAQPKNVSLRPAQIERIVGLRLAVSDVIKLLQRLSLDPVASGESVVCHVPSFRADITREIDLIEEVIRLHGYQHVPMRARVAHAVPVSEPDEAALRLIRRTLQGAGWHEAVCYSFADAAEAALFLSPGEGTLLRVADPGRKEMNTLRPALWPGLLRACRHNQNNGNPQPLLFEHASVYWQPAEAARGAPHEEQRLALIGPDLSLVRGALELLVAKLSAANRLQVQPMEQVQLASGVGGQILLQALGQGDWLPIGSLGRFSPAIEEYYGLKHPLYGFEVQLSKLLGAFDPMPQAAPIPRFPAVSRDLSVVVSDDVRWNALEAAVAALKPDHLAKLRFQGVYRGKQLGAGRKSVTFTMDFLSPTATLRSEEVDGQVQAVVTALQQQFAAELRN
ncbi:MAG: phenylalanine--tRNA ligase subunit beta [Phycisphaerales bacterium]|nr:phenylalanine--tRNA ligase subunit beta [Phycisphaerales bacterium]